MGLVRIPIRDASGDIVKVVEADEKTDAALLGRINQLEAERAELFARLSDGQPMKYEALRSRISQLETENADLFEMMSDRESLCRALVSHTIKSTETVIESTERANRLATINASLIANERAREANPGNFAGAPHDSPPRRRRRKKLTEAQLYAREYRGVNAGAPA